MHEKYPINLFPSHLNTMIINFIQFLLHNKFFRMLVVIQRIPSLQSSKGVMTCISQEVKDLYNLLEHEFSPLDLATKVQPFLAKVSKISGKLASASSVPEVQLSQYAPALEKLTVLRVLQQVDVFNSHFQIKNVICDLC